MKNLSNAKFPEAKVGSTVQLKIPDVDRGRGDPRSVIAVVLKITEDGFYQLGCKSGILKQLYARSQFTTCSENLISLSDIPQEKQISLRSAATEQSIGNGQVSTRIVDTSNRAPVAGGVVDIPTVSRYKSLLGRHSRLESPVIFSERKIRQLWNGALL
ncbi:hypothetical protein ACI65C_008770 [Semiaphis heraclei]